EALELIKDKKETELDDKDMRLYGEDKEYNINLRELGFYYDYTKAVEDAYSIGRKGNIINRIKEIVATKKSSINIPLESNYDKGKVDGLVDKIAEEIDMEMQDAGFNFNNGKII